MREENGIRYYEEKEKVMTFTEWYDGLTCSVNAIAYILDPCKSLVSIMAEAITEKDNEKLENLLILYDEARRAILCGVYTPEECSLLL
jgi:hypothetical protein